MFIYDNLLKNEAKKMPKVKCTIVHSRVLRNFLSTTQFNEKATNLSGIIIASY